MNFQSVQAEIVMIAWPFIVFYLFRRYPIADAALFSFLGGNLFLPDGAWFRLPLFPLLDKYSLTYVTMFLAVVTGPRKARGHLEKWIYPTFIASFLSGIAVWYTNQEPLFYGPTVIRGLVFKDGMFQWVQTMIGTPLVTWLGMKCFRDERDVWRWVTMLTGFGLVNGAMALVEIRLSPVFKRWVYGYDFGDFVMMQRHGGYRPQVLMINGLALALFLLGALLTAALLARYKRRVWKLSGMQAMWFLVIVVALAKSTAVWVYAIISVPLVYRSRAKVISRFGLVLVALACAYPMLRWTGLFPVEPLLNLLRTFGEDRAASMEFRFANEDVLLEFASKKPWFGWSMNYGRGMVYSPITGLTETVTDGGWIIALLSAGITGLIGYFAVPVWAVVTVARRLPRIADPRMRTLVAGLACYVAICWIDILPNGSFTLLPQFLAGALCSMTYNLAKRPPARDDAAAAPAATEAGTQPSTAPA